MAVVAGIVAGWWLAGWLGGEGERVAEVKHSHGAELKHDDGAWRFTNALAGETSPYLLQHAHNPVDWKPWGKAAFEEARRRQVPIFLSVGYSTCYWCHVMERQVFENVALAEEMNRRFVCIKVDREERPDVDNLYMTATQLLTGQGGWPMSVFLTPPPPPEAPGSPEEAAAGQGGFRGGLLPFWAGTYIPPEAMHGRPGFGQVMGAMTAAWEGQRGEVVEQGRRVAGAVAEQLAQEHRPGPVDGRVVGATVAALMGRYDREDGGFTGVGGPKFPTPVVPGLLLAVSGDSEAGGSLPGAVHHTLARMARGGMYDQVGGGFHRYSVDGEWLVPHFEKMLYDNGQLLELYAAGYEADPGGANAGLYGRVMRETGRYLLREMRDGGSGGASGGGAFWSAQDAEVDAREGGNYVWTADQVREALKGTESEELTDLALTMYGLDRGPNFTDPHAPEGEGAEPVNVLYVPRALGEIEGYGDAAEVAAKRERINAVLLRVRDEREQPSTDDKVLAGWNGLAIAGLAEAGRVLGEAWMVDAAQEAAEAVLSRMSSGDGGLYRTMRRGEASSGEGYGGASGGASGGGAAFLEDYAFVVHGLLALHRARPGGGRYLDEAVRLMAYAEERFAVEEGAYYDTLADQSDLFVRAASTYDGAVPSGTSVMLHNLMDLYKATGEARYVERAVGVARGLAVALERAGPGMAHAVHAVARLRGVAPAEMLAKLEAPATTQAAGGAVLRVDHGVTATAEAVPGGNHVYRVTVTIPEGLHLNANPAGVEGLVPTTLAADGVEVEVEYPAGTMKRYPFADEALPVYEGEVVLQVDAAGAVERFVLRYQACNETTCFAPAELVVEVD